MWRNTMGNIALLTMQDRNVDNHYVTPLLDTIFRLGMWADSVYDDIYHGGSYPEKLDEKDRAVFTQFLLALINVYGDITRKWAGDGRYTWRWEEGM